MSNLFLDDIRDPKNVAQSWHDGGWIEFPSHYAWDVVRSYKEFVAYIQANGLPTRIAFDHDLSYEDQNKTENFKEKTGMDCAKWLVDYCMDKELVLPEFYVHSFNVVGRMNIANLLTRFQEHQRSQNENRL